MTTIIAFDTVFDQCSIAIITDGEALYEDTHAGGRGQTEIILPMLNKALNHTNTSLSDIDALAFNQGPGAFSGIRINTAVVQALSFALDLPCVGISSLRALAGSFVQHHEVDRAIIASCIDARQNELYTCFYQYDNAVLTQMGNEALLPYDSQIKADFIIGNGGEFIKTDGKLINLNPTASDIGKMAYVAYLNHGGVNAQNALPVYLRHNAWKTLVEQGKK